MNKRTIRHYLLVTITGMVCWLNASVVMAQTATDVDCTACVGRGEVANNTVTWLNIDWAARQFLINQANDVNNSVALVNTLETQVATLQATVVTLQASLATNATDVATVTAANAALATTVGGHTTSIAANVTAVNGHTASITSNASGISSNIESIATNASDIDGLELSPVPNLGTYVRVGTHNGKPAVIFEAANVLVWDGTGSTDGITNGVGNLIVGYDEDESPRNVKTGSHNLVVGPYHTYSSWGGLVAGERNIITGMSASVSGGYNNDASGLHSSVSAGANNTASGIKSSVSGGGGGTASGAVSSVSGGDHNTASGGDSSVSGGNTNIASGASSSVGGGNNREASGVYDWAAGSLLEEY